MWPSLNRLVLYRAIQDTLQMKDWIPFQFDKESVSDYGKRVIMQLIAFVQESIESELSLANVHGICFDKYNLCDIIGETSIVDKIVFKDMQDRYSSNSLHIFKDDKLKKDDIENVTILQFQLIDTIMTLLKIGNPPRINYWNLLQLLHNLERFDIICMGLTGIVKKETHLEDIEKLRLKLNIAFGYYENGIVENFDTEQQRQYYERFFNTNFLKSNDPLTQLIFSEHPSFVKNNGEATRKLFKDQQKIICCSASTGTSTMFTPRDNSAKKQKMEQYGNDVLQHEEGVYFVHYGRFHTKGYAPSIGDILSTNGYLYVSMSPRWKWNGNCVFVLKMRPNVTCDLIKPPSYAELCILEANNRFLKTAVLPSVRISNCVWKVTKFQYLEEKKLYVTFCSQL